MLLAVVSQERCSVPTCHQCPARQACPTKALLRLDRDEPAIVDTGRCRGCGRCVPVCPWEAIKLQDH